MTIYAVGGFFRFSEFQPSKLIPKIYMPEQIQPLKMEKIEETQVKKPTTGTSKHIIKDKPDYDNFPECSLSETIENHLKRVRNLKYTKVKWEDIHHEHNGKIYELRYSKELDIAFHKTAFDNKLNPTYNNNSIDIYI